MPLVIIAYFIDLQTVDISHNIENFKEKISNVHDDKHLVTIKMSTSRGRVKRQTRANYRLFLW